MLEYARVKTTCVPSVRHAIFEMKKKNTRHVFPKQTLPAISVSWKLMNRHEDNRSLIGIRRPTLVLGGVTLLASNYSRGLPIIRTDSTVDDTC